MSIKLQSSSGGSVELKAPDSLTTDEVVEVIGGLGLTGETWVNELGNKQLDVEYTNDTGKPIMVSVSVRNDTSPFTTNPSLVIDSILVSLFVIRDNTSYQITTVQGIVPPGSTYKVESSYGEIETWMELK